MRKYRAALLAVVLIGCVGYAVSQQTQRTPRFNTVDITGQLRSPSGHSGNVAGILIVLQNRTGAEVSRMMTDSKGQFVFQALSPGYYHVMVQEQGYRPTSTDVDLTFSPSARVDLDLIPDGKQGHAAPSGTVNALTAGLSADARSNFEEGLDKLLKQNKAESSISNFKKVEKLEPKFASAYAYHALALIQSGKPQDAEKVAREGLKNAPQDFSNNFWLGMALNTQQKFNDSEKPLRAAVKAKPESPEANYELSRSLLGQGKWQEAEPLALSCQKSDPKFAAVNVVLGNISLKKREGTQALAYFQKYLELEPNGVLAPATRDIVAKLQAALKAAAK